MSKVRLTGSNSGYVEIAAAADAGNLTFIMPTTGNLINRQATHSEIHLRTKTLTPYLEISRQDSLF